MTDHLDLEMLKRAARTFVADLSATPIPDLFGITDGKAVGTYVEHAFRDYLDDRYDYAPGSSALGIDFPDLNVDLKVTSIKQPQSSCPYRTAAQKVYGLGYDLLVFIYEKSDDQETRTAWLRIVHAFFVNDSHAADYQTTRGLLEILDRAGNKDDVTAFLEERNLPLDEIGRDQLADRILADRPRLGYLTISNALQWRLQYRRLITLMDGEDQVDGLEALTQ